MVALVSTRTMVIGRPEGARRLRDGLNRAGAVAATVTELGDLVALRRDLLVHPGLVVICVEVQEQSLRRFGRSLRALLADRRGFAADVRVIGIHRGELAAEALALGCDAYAQTVRGVMHWRRALNGHRTSRASLRRINASQRRSVRSCGVVSTGDVDISRRLTEEQSAVFLRAEVPARGFTSRSRLG